MRENVIETIKKEKLIAIVRGIAPEKCLKVAGALYAGGFRLVEITFDQKNPESWATTAAAIKAVSEAYSGTMEVGAGTVTSVELVELAASAGAKYIISPDTNIDVIKRTRELGLVSMPGALTPTEILTAYNNGADFVKLFPIANLGPAYVKAVRAPISHVPVMENNGGCQNDGLHREGLSAKMKVAHLGINAANAENAAQIAELFHVLFGFEPKYGNSSIFVGDKMIEIVKENGRGTNGHICIAVDDMAKAMDELKEKGVAFDESSAKYKNGELTAIYFQNEIAGFAIHLLKN